MPESRWCISGVGSSSRGEYEVWIDSDEGDRCYYVDRETFLAARAQFEANDEEIYQDGPLPEWTARFDSTLGYATWTL